MWNFGSVNYAEILIWVFLWVVLSSPLEFLIGLLVMYYYDFALFPWATKREERMKKRREKESVKIEEKKEEVAVVKAESPSETGSNAIDG